MTSRRLRNRPDKRATALDLARLFGHGTSMPVGDEPPEEDRDFEIPEPDTRRQIGPLDVAATKGQQ